MAGRYTQKQGQYLAFIYYYTKIHGMAPAESEMQRYFGVTPPSVHQMVLSLEERGLITRTPGTARSIMLTLSSAELPDLECRRELALNDSGHRAAPLRGRQRNGTTYRAGPFRGEQDELATGGQRTPRTWIAARKMARRPKKSVVIFALVDGAKTYATQIDCFPFCGGVHPRSIH